MNPTLELLTQRRSERNYTDEPISCLVSYDHISQRILKLALARDVLGNLLATLKAQTV